MSDSATKDSLKFTPELTELIKKGEKTSTFRFGKKKNLQVGDIAEFITRHDAVNIEHFGYARINSVRTFVLKDLPIDYEGHGQYSSKEDQLKSYKGYYGDEVTLESEFTVYDFEYLGENWPESNSNSQQAESSRAPNGDLCSNSSKHERKSQVILAKERKVN